MIRATLELEVRIPLLLASKHPVPSLSEVKIMSIPKIAISNEDDASLRIIETHAPMINRISTPPSPYKSIIKHRPSQASTLSSTSTGTHTYYTCQTRLNPNYSHDTFTNAAMKSRPSEQFQMSNHRIIDENDTENDVSELSQFDSLSKAIRPVTEPIVPRRRGTISTTSVLHSGNYSSEHRPQRQYSLRQNRSPSSNHDDGASVSMTTSTSRNSFTPNMTSPPPPLPYAEKDVRSSLTQTTHDQRRQRRRVNPVRRANSHRPTSSAASITLRPSEVADGKLIQQEIRTSQALAKRRSTFDNSSYPVTQLETSSIYETPKYHENEQYTDVNGNSAIRLVMDTDLHTQLTANDHSDMQLSVNNERDRTKSPEQVQVCHLYDGMIGQPHRSE